MSLSYEITNWENGKTVLKAEHLRKIEKGITDIIAENDAIYKDEDTRKSNEKQRQEEHSRKMNEVSEVVSDIQKDYDSLQKIIIDENASANLQNQINQTNSQLEQNMNKINDQFNTKASKQEVDVERKRIDSLAKLSEGSTTGDAELIDARIGADGINYGNLGTAIRTQFSDINTVLDKPTYLIRNGSYEKEGGDVVWDNITIDLVAKENTITKEQLEKIDVNKLAQINSTLQSKGIANARLNSLINKHKTGDTISEDILKDLISKSNMYTKIIDILIPHLEADQVEYLNKLKQFMKDNQQNNDSCNPRF